MNLYHGSRSFPFDTTRPDLCESKPCGYCSNGFQQIYHGGKCPKVKSIEYHENGTVKKVEFFGDEKPKPVGFNEWIPGKHESDQTTS